MAFCRISVLFFTLSVWASLGTNSTEASEQGFANCASLFPGETLVGVPSGPSKGRTDLCYRSADQPFFALRYNFDRRLPDWVAYRVVDTFGEDKCGSVPRNHMRCHFADNDIEKCIRIGEKHNEWPPDLFIRTHT